MSFVIRAADGRYLRVWYGLALGAPMTRVDLVEKKDASSFKKRAEAQEVANALQRLQTEVR
jgi:hypothetical protein